MTVLRYLEKLASDLNIAEKEKESISTSIQTIKYRLETHFDDELEEVLRFGSSTRNTMLPRSADAKSDVDYLVVFYSDYNPQTYLNKLKRFANKYYPYSYYRQSSPTVVLELNHLMFDLVPGRKGLLWGYKIPAPGDFTFEKWKATQPLSLNDDINNMNKLTGYKLKQAVRILKYWNAKNNYVFPSYELEQMLVAHAYYGCSNLKDYFYESVNCASYRTWSMPEYKKIKLKLLEEKKNYIKKMDEMGHPDEALRELEKLIPQMN